MLLRRASSTARISGNAIESPVEVDEATVMRAPHDPQRAGHGSAARARDGASLQKLAMPPPALDERWRKRQDESGEAGGKLGRGDVSWPKRRQPVAPPLRHRTSLNQLTKVELRNGSNGKPRVQRVKGDVPCKHGCGGVATSAAPLDLRACPPNEGHAHAILLAAGRSSRAPLFSAATCGVPTVTGFRNCIDGASPITQTENVFSVQDEVREQAAKRARIRISASHAGDARVRESASSLMQAGRFARHAFSRSAAEVCHAG